MKVLLATESYWPNLDGGSVVERNLALGLAALGHEVRIIAPSVDGKEGVQRDGRTDIHRTRSFKLPGKFGKVGARGSLFAGKAVKDLIDGWQPDVIHIHNPFGIGRAAMKHGRAARVPILATNHNMPENTLDNLGFFGKLIPNGEARIWKWQMKFLNQANFVTSPTQTAVDMLLAHGLSVPHKAVSNGVDLQKYKPGPASEKIRRKFHLPRKPTLLYTGRLDGEKKLDVWLDAAALIAKQIDAHFLLVGRGSGLQPLKRQAASVGIADRTTFTGPVSDDDLVALYKCGTVFAISSPAELQSLVTLEAMASGLPIVVADAAALPELCKSGRNGYLFTPGDAEGMAKSAGRILTNPAMSKKMGAESRKIVERHHDVRQMPKNYLKIYKEIIRP